MSHIIIATFEMNMTWDDEYRELMNLIKFKKYRRYGNDLYAHYQFDDGYEWKFEYNLCEIVWGFCKNPCFANTLVKKLEEDVPDMNKCITTLAKGNNKISSKKMFSSWSSAMDAIDLNDTPKPMIVYSTESSHVLTNKKVFCNDVDGDMWHGLLMTDEVIENLEHISVELTGVNSNGKLWSTEYRWFVTDVVSQSKRFEREDSGLMLFSPFKHPIILMGSGINIAVSFHFMDGRLPDESQIRMIYGLCNTVLHKWIETPSTTFTTHLAYDRKLIVDTSNGRVDEVSMKVNRK